MPLTTYSTLREELFLDFAPSTQSIYLSRFLLFFEDGKYLLLGKNADGLSYKSMLHSNETLMFWDA